jgi:hypothetical protein
VPGNLHSHEEDQMPDADDFDVEYFRELLKGNSPREVSAPPAGPALPVAKKSARPAARPSAARPKGTPAASRKKGGK